MLSWIFNGLANILSNIYNYNFLISKLYGYNLLMTMITCDSLFSAIYTIKVLINQNLTESQIVVKSNSLYDYFWLERYIYYLFCQIFYKIVCTFLWLNSSSILSYILLITIIPPILNKILNSALFQIIRRKKEELIKKIIAQILTHLIKYGSKIYLEKDIKLEYPEILNLFKDYRDTLNYFLEVLKNCAVILGLAYVKEYSDRIYYILIKYGYNYKTGNAISSYNVQTAKQYLLDIITYKKWHKLKKANAYKAMLCLYQANTDNTDIVKKIINEFNFSLIMTSAICTLSSVMSTIYAVPIISFVVLIYQKFIGKIDYKMLLGESVILGGSSILCYFTKSYLLMSIFCQYVPKILVNNFSYILIDNIYMKSKTDIYNIFSNNNDLTISYFVTIMYILILKFFNIKDVYYIIILNLCANIMMSIEIKKQVIFGLLLISTNISNYNIIHIILNSGILYITTGFLSDPVIFKIKLIINYYFNLDRIMKFFKELCLLFKNKININIIKNQEEQQRKTRFDLMNTEKFPSISTTVNNIDEIKCSKFEDSVSLDDEIFNQPEDIFISEISIDDNTDNNFMITNNGNCSVVKDFLD